MYVCVFSVFFSSFVSLAVSISVQSLIRQHDTDASTTLARPTMGQQYLPDRV